MFCIGDRVVYPMHGAGIIESLEEREILGKRQQYFVMRIPLGEMKVYIPESNVDNMGLRQIVPRSDVPKVIEALRDAHPEEDGNWNRRYRANLEKLRTGCILATARVVSNLMARERQKGLSTGEKRMLETARQILISELILVENKSEAMVQELITRECS
ncbi:MAG: CarD family transcriptional regulator [Firmicutes bacterium]|nr:CarD family transcriptional regulator [Dethiobacter sp.]MBS3889143.1 CarD family transcriptional regulator [Bacillota bacterium]MBS4054263.1 CarD family transcriptional regulator [Thermaerobacter sp.]